MSEVKFKITKAGSWNGNGCGTDPAHWAAVVGGEVVATWRNDASGLSEAVIYGERRHFIYTYGEWRRAVQEEHLRRGAAR